jgi:hypothetical protein
VPVLDAKQVGDMPFNFLLLPARIRRLKLKNGSSDLLIRKPPRFPSFGTAGRNLSFDQVRNKRQLFT